MPRTKGASRARKVTKVNPKYMTMTELKKDPSAKGIPWPTQANRGTLVRLLEAGAGASLDSRAQNQRPSRDRIPEARQRTDDTAALRRELMDILARLPDTETSQTLQTND